MRPGGWTGERFWRGFQAGTWDCINKDWSKSRERGHCVPGPCVADREGEPRAVTGEGQSDLDHGVTRHLTKKARLQFMVTQSCLSRGA